MLILLLVRHALCDHVGRVIAGRTPGIHLSETGRALDEAARFEREHPGAVVVAVSHGDVIRSLVAHYAGMPIDLLLRLEISPASVSAVRLEAHGPRLLWINATHWKDLLRREL